MDIEALAKEGSGIREHLLLSKRWLLKKTCSKVAREAIAESVAAEREACAKVCEDLWQEGSDRSRERHAGSQSTTTASSARMPSASDLT